MTKKVIALFPSIRRGMIPRLRKEWLFSSASVLLLLLTASISAKTEQTLIVDFDRELLETDNKEQASGTIYCLPPNRITVIVDKPINQWMIFSEKKLEIYYPDEQKAFRFTSEYPFQLSFFQAFLRVLYEDYRLGDLGYVLVQRFANGDTVTTIWKPPKSLAKLLGEFYLIYDRNKIIRAESRNADGSVASRTSFSNHYEFSGFFFPLEITTIRFFKSDSTIEKISFAEPEFNTKIPQDIIYFTFPPDVEIEETEW
jgi:outer membrane lipoprotein-sorting protein